ncbi:toluene monooxygenase [Rugosibacter aromaticivorans]|uniref:Toluene monooxygenase n=1 Tax=Rugosibacter aromaticivorans TaxID=1565605 RepID=A0A0C5J9A6_9PROT|nr:aromatic/alkene monooxygenase hydroxylase subunit beta [Rugosibacter aromaticivorans]AJP48254.1 toluene monooxygenase [Rugosibacter aromaticivorans]TBR15187.1 MAG: toluene monooxygenase [Rugosibacter sp.]
MSETEVLKPLKTWSHLAKRRRKPSEYEIVSVNILYNTRDPNAPYDLDPNLPMNRWYKQYRNDSLLQHDDWNAFRDPDELVYRTYNMLQDGQETYVFGLFNQFNEREHDKALEPQWAGTLARLYTPARYLFHTLQMASAYIQQMSPASTITNCAAFQAADSLRWLSHTAYRTKELSLTFTDKGFGTDERTYWETDPAWQGFRELMEKVLTTWDWGEAFVALNLVAKPAIEEAVLRKLGEAGRHNGDTLLGMLTDSQLLDANRHRRWATALVKMTLEKSGNAEAIKPWIAKWEPLADKAIDVFCTAMPEVPDAAADARSATRDFRLSLAL